MAENCSDATIAALCCVYGEYVNIGAIKTDDPDICGVPAGQIVVSSVVTSQAGPWGYDPITQTLTIPDNSNLLGAPVWNYDSVNQTMRLQMTQIDGSVFYLPVHSRGTVSEKSSSFQDKGVGLEIIHSDENSGVLPASPSVIVDASGTANRKYRNHQPYFWFNDDHGKFTHWWNPTRSQWEVIRTNRNVLIVHPSGGGNLVEFSTLSAAYTYLASLPALPDPDDPNQDAQPTATNRWTILIHGRITETAQVNARDWVDVFFMPGGQLYCTATSGPGVMFDGSSALRLDPGLFPSNWSSIGASTFATPESRAANIVRNSGTSTGISSCIQINSMTGMSLTNIGLFFESGDNNFNHHCILVTGSLLGTNTIRSGVYLRRVVASMSAPNNNTWPFYRSSLQCQHTSGALYAEDCKFVFTPNSFGLGSGVLAPSGTATLYLTECFVNASKQGSSHALWGQVDGTTYAINSTFEAYGDSTNAYGSSAFQAAGNSFASKCIFRIASIGVAGASPNALTAGLAASSACVYHTVADANVAVFEDCMFYANTTVSTGLTLELIGAWAETKLRMTGCVIRATLASIASLTGTQSTTKQIYRSHLDCPIAGASFGCAAATTTYNTSFLV